jgi:polysaccharide pyruvyl transferase WcaK-like protein
LATRILVDAGNYFSNNDNLGDRAIYQSIVRQLRQHWSGCEITWLTRNADLLQTTCPEVVPLALIDPPHVQMPISRFWQWTRWVSKPAQRPEMHIRHAVDARQIERALRECDLVLATGGGYFCDSFASHARSVLNTLEMGIQTGKPAAILSCGFEPTSDTALAEKMLSVLPRLSLIACREPTQSPAVIRSYGVAEQQLMVAGDDAIEQAFNLRPPSLGRGLGINLREASYANVDAWAIGQLRATLLQSALKLGAPLLPVPISLFGPSDIDAIRTLLAGYTGEFDSSCSLKTPEDVILQAGRCRMLLTGSYHAAVFALAQGVSVVALAASAHYRAKLLGLKAQFGDACRVVMLNRDDTDETLALAIDEVWSQADSVRPGLLGTAQRLTEANRAVYQRMRDLTTSMRHDEPYRVQQPGRPAKDAPDYLDFSMKLAAMTPTSTPAFALTPEEIETFRNQGYVGPFTAFDADHMERVRQIIHDRVLTTPTPYCPFGLRVRHLDSRTVYDLCAAPAIVGRMQSLFGPDLVLWNSNLFNKPPARPDQPEEYPWHQDHYNWNMEPVLNVSAWLAISPATLENGCVEVIPGSHRQIVPAAVDTNPDLSLRFGGIASDPAYVDTTKKIALPLAPGQFFLFNERLLHHSNPNRTQEHRLGLAVRVTVPLVKVNEAFPCILLSGEDRMGFNRYAERPSDEPDAEWLAALPPEHDFRFDRPIPGMGWHVRETDNQLHFAWTGLEPEAWIDFRPLHLGDHVLRCEVIHILAEQAFESAQISVNGKNLQLERRRAGATLILQARVPTAYFNLRNDRIRVSLTVQKRLRPCDLDPASPDKRQLGLGVSRISLSRA